MSANDEPPFDPTAMYDTVDAVIVDESLSADAVLEKWTDTMVAVNQSIGELDRAIKHVDAYERRLSKLDDENLNTMGRWLRRSIDLRFSIEAVAANVKERESALLERFKDKSEALGLDKFSTDYGTISVPEKDVAAYDPDKYDGILVALVGVEIDDDRLNALDVAMQAHADGREEVGQVEAAIRAFISKGRLDVLQRRFTDSKVADLAISESGLPEGLRLEPVKKASFTRPAGTRQAL